MDKLTLDIATVAYIVNHYSGLFDKTERMTLYHARSIFKFNIDRQEQNTLVSILRQTGWLGPEQTLSDIKKEGQTNFDYRIAEKIIGQHKEDVFFNYCKKCGQLARTPSARQCNHCGYSWHHLLVAKFKVNAIYELSGKGYFLIGELIKGTIDKSYIVDFVRLGLSQRAIIKSIEFVKSREGGISKDEIALQVDQLSKRDLQNLEKGLKDAVDIFKI